MSGTGEEERNISKHLSRRNSLPRVTDDAQYIHNPVSPVTPPEEKTDVVQDEPHSVLLLDQQQQQQRANLNRRPSTEQMYANAAFSHDTHHKTEDDMAPKIAEVANRDLVRRPSLTASQLGLPPSMERKASTGPTTASGRLDDPLAAEQEEVPCDKNTSDILLANIADRVQQQEHQQH